MKKEDLQKKLQFGDKSYLLNEPIIDNPTDYSGEEQHTAPYDRFVYFKDHPFSVNTESEAFQELVESISKNGLIYPLLVRPADNDKLEIIAGHRRLEACKSAGVTEIPYILRTLDDYDATILMVHSNFYRSSIRISEKAKAYRMCMEAEKHQGVKGVDTAALAGKDEDSKRQVYRYVRVSYLSVYFLNLLDEGILKFNTGVELSYLNDESQSNLERFITELNHVPSLDEAKLLRKSCEEEQFLSYESIVSLMVGALKKPASKSISIKKKEIEDYFGEDADVDFVHETIIRLLEKYKEGALNDILGL